MTNPTENYEPLSRPGTLHFHLDEFSSPTVTYQDGKPKVSRSKRETPPEKFHENLQRLMNALEVVRAVTGGTIKIVSGWRSKAFNDPNINPGRAVRSKHLLGQAADLRAAGVTPAVLYWVINDLMASGHIPLGGLAMYPTYVHYDIRGQRPRAWKLEPRRPKNGLGSKRMGT